MPIQMYAIERRLEGREVLHQRRRVGEVEHPRAAGPPGDHQPEKMLQAEAGHAVERPRSGIAPQMLAAVTFDPALDGLEQVGPHRLRAEIAAPDAAGDRVHQEQGQRGKDQEAGEIIDLLRPELDEEEIEPAVRQVDQTRPDVARRCRGPSAGTASRSRSPM